jgi:hypothetical protein
VKLRARLLRAVSGDAGPAVKAVLRGLARHHGALEEFEATFRAMLADGALKMYGQRKAARYGVPGWRRAR